MRPVVYDATHLVSRMGCVATTGIDRVELAYARHFVAHPLLACGLHCGLRHPHLFAPWRFAALVDFFERRLGETERQASGEDYRRLREWLSGRQQASQPTRATARPPALSALAKKTVLRVAHDKSCSTPASAIYLNVAQHILEYPIFFEWLSRRPDVLPVFVIHDLLPLDHPEFFRAGYEQRFRRRVDTILRHAGAVITTSAGVARRVKDEFNAHGRTVPIHVQPLASPLEQAGPPEPDSSLAESAYFVMVSTMEPRKNHMLLLNIWRTLATQGAPVPKLVLVGMRGWDNDQALQFLERSELLAPHVRMVSGLSSVELRQLIGNARALLTPSFAEGYGLPIVEALSLGVPVIASDIPVFHEVARGSATFLSPIDGTGWRETIKAFSGARPDLYAAALAQAKNFAAPNWAGYFDGIEAFLATL